MRKITSFLAFSLMVLWGMQLQAQTNATITWTLNYPDGQTPTFSDGIEANFTSTAITLGSNMELNPSPRGYKNSVTGDSISCTQFNPIVSIATDEGGADDVVRFVLTTKAGVTFTPDSISFKCMRIGTDGGFLSAAWVSSDGTSTPIGEGVTPGRNSATPKDGVEAPTSIGAKLTVSANSGEGMVVFTFGGKLADNKDIAIANLVIEGTLSGDVVLSAEETSIDKAIVSAEYFDLIGKEVSQDTKGIVIKKVTYEDGRVEVIKSFVK